MATRPIERLLFTQGGLCFFCQKPLPPADASIEHLVATANGGRNAEDNCVACCTALNSLFGRMSLKAKLQVVLNQKGVFKCPNGSGKTRRTPATAADTFDRVIVDLRKRGKARPGTLAKLTSTINNLFQKRLSPQQLNAIIDKLAAKGVISIDDLKVSYNIPAA